MHEYKSLFIWTFDKTQQKLFFSRTAQKGCIKKGSNYLAQIQNCPTINLIYKIKLKIWLWLLQECGLFYGVLPVYHTCQNSICFLLHTCTKDTKLGMNIFVPFLSLLNCCHGYMKLSLRVSESSPWGRCGQSMQWVITNTKKAQKSEVQTWVLSVEESRCGQSSTFFIPPKHVTNISFEIKEKYQFALPVA